MSGLAPLKLAVISGGSSGIGLACARVLLGQGHRVVLLARDPDRLAQARSALVKSETGRAAVDIKSVDVTDAAAVAAVLREIAGLYGPIDWLIASAGIAEPGLFRDLDPSSHRDQMETNYFGTLNLVRAALPVMRRGSRMVLVSSGAAFVGIAGYSGYAPSKFAVRALAEILRLELEPDGIAVSVAFPPDTDTPQLARELPKRPRVTTRIAAQGGVMSASEVAGRIIERADAGAFVIAPSRSIALLALFHSLYRPVLAWQQRRILSRGANSRRR